MPTLVRVPAKAEPIKVVRSKQHAPARCADDWEIIWPHRILAHPDALLDPRFQNNPPVTGELYIRFYAGFPLKDRDGYPIGALYILDRGPRKLRDREVRALRE
ncbi:GAF domain-containing protein [Janthinobacterium sp. RB2P8]|uniref:GAF domain-containing protein n=1 Tax=Janthinobacterium sp. RB2P8 TaxID=3424191 RepID=UPI003F28DC2F